MQWQNLPSEELNREDLLQLHQTCPAIQLEDKLLLQGKGIVNFRAAHNLLANDRY